VDASGAAAQLRVVAQCQGREHLAVGWAEEHPGDETVYRHELRPVLTEGCRGDGRVPAPKPVVTQVMQEAGLPLGKPASDLRWSLVDSNS